MREFMLKDYFRDKDKGTFLKADSSGDCVNYFFSFSFMEWQKSGKLDVFKEQLQLCVAQDSQILYDAWEVQL